MKNILEASTLLSVNPTKTGLRDPRLHVIYGSRTGNSKAAAQLAFDYAGHLGLEAVFHNMELLESELLSSMQHILIAVSTHGEGDPPATVERFYDFVHSTEMPRLEGVKFSILALGDSSYRDFCKTGHDIRNRLLEKGAEEIFPLVACDIDYEENAMTWVSKAVGAFEAVLPKTAQANSKSFAFEINKMGTANDQMFYAKVKDLQELTNASHSKTTLHVSLSMKSFGAHFEPGDSFGIYAHNARFLVDKLLKVLNYDGSYAIESGDAFKMLKELLLEDYEITLITPLVVQKYALVANNEALNRLVANEQGLTDYCRLHDVLDMVTDFPSEIPPSSFVSILRKLSPRLYSVANSPLKYPDELHLTMSLMDYQLNNRRHRGLCSAFFAHRLEVGASVPVFLETNQKFRVPADGSLPVVMIGTGTGIAPFRAFMQHRECTGAKGDNWLIFGDRHANSDHLYGHEFEKYYQSGLLTHWHTAFSRDQMDKIYVQHRMLEHSAELFKWMDQRGAVVYLCGNKRTMGYSVKEALAGIIAREGAMSPTDAAAYLKAMKEDDRLQMDLY
jgi:sulfite reductase (NADPH) flavoprotein alpha-component